MKELSEKLRNIPVSAALAVDLRTRELLLQGRDVVSFCVGEPDLPTFPHVRRAGISAIEAGKTRYTNASGTDELKEAVSFRLREDFGLDYGKKPIAVTTGGKYAVYAALSALCDPGGEVILETARMGLEALDPALAEGIDVFMPDEKARRLGQSVAAAQIPVVKK